MAETYDDENIFSKILDGKVPCFKVFESKTSLAFLDAFPVAEGHTLLVPKLKGYTQFIDMPASKAAEFSRDLHKVAQAVKLAFGATGVNIVQNNGADAGQEVLHPHFHIIPRFKDDGKPVKFPPSAKEMLKPEAAAPVVKKLQEALNPPTPPTPLAKAKFSKISDIQPDSTGLNLMLKVLGDVTSAEAKGGATFEVRAGDASGTAVLSLRDAQKDLVKPDSTIILRNAAVKMVAGHVRLQVDKWGKMEASEEEVEEVNKADDKNISSTEYELVAH